MIIYVIGIPLIQYIALKCNKDLLYPSYTHTQQQLKDRRGIEKSYGVLFINFREECWYFEFTDAKS